MTTVRRKGWKRLLRSLVLRFGCAGQRCQKSEGILNCDWDWWWSRQMGSVRLVTVFVGDVSGLDCLSVRRYVSHTTLDHGNGLTEWSCLEGTDLFLSDSVFGLETINIGKTLDPITEWSDRLRKSYRTYVGNFNDRYDFCEFNYYYLSAYYEGYDT
jgi:hypothetical protein